MQDWFLRKKERSTYLDYSMNFYGVCPTCGISTDFTDCSEATFLRRLLVAWSSDPESGKELRLIYCKKGLELLKAFILENNGWFSDHDIFHSDRSKHTFVICPSCKKFMSTFDIKHTKTSYTKGLTNIGYFISCIHCNKKIKFDKIAVA